MTYHYITRRHAALRAEQQGTTATEVQQHRGPHAAISTTI